MISRNVRLIGGIPSQPSTARQPIFSDVLCMFNYVRLSCTSKICSLLQYSSFASSLLDRNCIIYTKSGLGSFMALKWKSWNWAYLQILIHRWTSRILSLGSTERNKQNELQTLTFPTIIISWLISRKFLVLVKKTHKLYRQSNSDLL